MNALAAESGYWLGAWLTPLAPFLDRAEVTDIYVNRPGEVWVEALGGGIERHEVPSLSRDTLARLARQIAAFSHQGISRAHPLLAASLPDGSRVQIVAPPATRGEIALAIRRHVAADLVLDDYVAGGAFGSAHVGSIDAGRAAWYTGPSGASCSITARLPPNAASGMPPPMTLPITVMSGSKPGINLAYTLCALPSATRQPVMTSS